MKVQKSLESRLGIFSTQDRGKNDGGNLELVARESLQDEADSGQGWASITYELQETPE